MPPHRVRGFFFFFYYDYSLSFFFLVVAVVVVVVVSGPHNGRPLDCTATTTVEGAIQRDSISDNGR